jgi:hypothetical protein
MLCIVNASQIITEDIWPETLVVERSNKHRESASASLCKRP